MFHHTVILLVFRHYDSGILRILYLPMLFELLSLDLILLGNKDEKTLKKNKQKCRGPPESSLQKEPGFDSRKKHNFPFV